MQEFKHYTVMKNEAVDALECKDGLIYADCTLGGGGHSELILKRISPNGKLVAFDIDQDAIDAATEKLKNYNNLIIVKESYTNIKQVSKKCFTLNCWCSYCHTLSPQFYISFSALCSEFSVVKPFG